MPLSASKRISLLKEISNRLQMEDWPLIDLTLSQFGLPIADEWHGDKSAYVMQMCKAGGTRATRGVPHRGSAEARN